MGFHVYKNIAYRPQATFGVSVVVGSYFLPVRTFDVNRDSEVTPVSQTTNTTKGLRRAVNVKDTITGTATFYPDFINLGYWTALAWGGTVTGATLGVSAQQITFEQNVSGNPRVGRFDVDKQVSIEGFLDTFVTEYQLTYADGQMEGTVTLQSSTMFSGTTFTAGTSIFETRTLTFANARLYYGNTTGVAGATIEMPLTNFTLTYRTGFAGAFQGGSDRITRADLSTYPTAEISFTRFFDGSSGALVTRDNTFTEDQERGMVLILTSDSDSVIAGTTPFQMRFPMPKVKLFTTERPYNNGEMIMENVTGQALFDDTLGYMIEPVLSTIRGVTYIQ